MKVKRIRQQSNKTTRKEALASRFYYTLYPIPYTLILLFFAFAPFLHAMPLNPDAYKKLKGTAKLGVIEAMEKTAPPELNKPSAQKFSTITGTRKILVILVDFSDNPGATPSANYDQMLFSAGTYATGSMRDYYREVSYGKFDINGTVTTKWYRAPQTYNYYVNYLAGIYGTYPNNAQKLVEDVVKLADADIDFSQYDSNGDGYVDGLFIVHAGGGAEADGNYGKIWAHKWTTSAPVSVDGVKVFDYTMEPEDGNIGVFCHEYGHELGLWDLYDTTNTAYGIGDFSVMGTGAWNNNAKTPAQLDAWSKIQLGWVTPIMPTTNQISAGIPQVETNATVYKLWTNGDSTSREYFLAENRQQTKFDAYLPGSGLVIYHVDDNVAGDNTNKSHYHVAVMQADGLKDLENKTNKGDAGDFFPGTMINKNFSGSTPPNSKSYAGTETYVAVSNVSASSAAMTADLYVSSGDASPPSCTVSALPQFTNTTSFTVAWSAQDAGNPATGVKNYDVQTRVTENGTPADWFTGTTATQAVYTGSGAQTYYFKCRAVDNSGNQGLYSSEAYTTLDFTPPTASITPLAATQVKAAFDVSWSGTDTISGVKSYDVEYMDAVDGVWKNNWVQAGTTLTSATFSGIDGHTYYFRIRATDNAGNTGSFTSASNGDAQTIVAVDSTPPVITMESIAKGLNDLAISWVTDEDADAQVEYGTTQNLGSFSMLDSTLKKDHGIGITFLLPATTYYFRVKSKDAAGNITASSIQSSRTLNVFSKTVPKGLSMIAFPLFPSGVYAGNVFEDANIKFARYDASIVPPKYHYYKEDPGDSYLVTKTGRGFWIKLDAEKTITVTGADETASTYSISLNAGWNQIGNPYTSSVDISALKVTYNNETLSFSDANKKGDVANYFWSYENETTGYKLLASGLSSGQTLDPGKGYWLYATVPCSLVFTNPSGTSTAKTTAKQNSATQNSSNLIQFTLSSSSGSDTENYAGFADDNMKISDPPPALEESGKPELLLKSSSANDAHYALVAKKKNYGEETFYLSATGNDGEQSTLSWNFNAAEFASAVLVDETGKEVSLLNEKQYAFTLSKEPKQFLLKLKLNSVISDPVLLNTLKILSVVPYPTPSRGKLSFNVEAEGSVDSILLEVYTITGKRILSQFLPAASSPGEKGKGKYKAESPSLDASLESLPSGVYVYRLQISNGVETVNKTGKFVVVK